MYNELEHDLITMELPNIVYRVKKGDVIPMQSHPFLVPLLTKLAKARPKWMLVGTQYVMGDSEDKFSAVRFSVVENGVELGRITKEYNYGTDSNAFGIDNQRMSAKRQRGNVTMTKDVTKAFKIITKEFHGKTTSELLTEAREVTYSKLTRVVHERSTNYSSTVYAARTSMMNYALENWDAYRSFATNNGVSATTLDQFIERKADCEEAEKLTTSWEGETGIFVVLRGSEYIVKQGDSTRILTNDELTPHMKRCIGMFKLADVGQFIPGMGVKGSDTAMYILPEEKVDD